MRNFKVEIRKTCKICGNPITKKRFRTFCSGKCREKAISVRHRKYRNNWQRKNWQKNLNLSGKPLIECRICGLKFRQVGSHITQKHKISARQYREQYGFDVKRGQLPKDLRKIKRDHALKNNMDKQLKKAGLKTRFKKGQKELGLYERSEQTLARLKTQFLNTPSGKNYEEKTKKETNSD